MYCWRSLLGEALQEECEIGWERAFLVVSVCCGVVWGRPMAPGARIIQHCIGVAHVVRQSHRTAGIFQRPVPPTAQDECNSPAVQETLAGTEVLQRPVLPTAAEQ